MPYSYDIFDGAPLPPLNPSQQLDPNGMGTALLRSIGGSFDVWGDTEGDANPQVYRIGGTYVGQVDYLTDETGDILVDETGDELIENSDLGSLRSQVDELRSKIRVRGALWRVQQEDTSIRQWKTARMQTLNHTITYRDAHPAADVVCQLETPMANWHAASITAVSVAALAGVALTFTIENTGETVEDAILWVTRGTGTITAFSLTCAALGIGLQWSAPSGLPIGAGQTMAINDGAATVSVGSVATMPLGAVDAYSGFGLSGHTAKSWLYLPPGIYNFTATALGGNASVSYQYYQQFK